MARRIVVSALGPKPIQAGPDKSLEDALQRMMAHWRDRLAQVLPNRPDLVVLPEACDRFPDLPLERRLEYYRHRGDRMRDFFSEIARSHGCCIAYSAARELADGSWRNSTQLIDRTGGVAGTYNKNYVVIEETTQAGILCGRDATPVRCDVGTIAFAICFDLNFDELRLRVAAAKPDLVVFSSMYHGGLMQAYWAYSCRAHFVGAVAGAECTVISPVGERLAASTNYFDHVTTTINLDCAVVHLDYNWSRLRKLKDAYGRGVTITDPGYLGSVLVTSETDGVDVQQMLDEFNVERLDDYFARARAHRAAHLEPDRTR